jgi:hypothetical protein
MDGGFLAYHMAKGVGVKLRREEGVRCQDRPWPIGEGRLLNTIHEPPHLRGDGLLGEHVPAPQIAVPMPAAFHYVPANKRA